MYGKNDNSQVKYIISTVYVICTGHLILHLETWYENVEKLLDISDILTLIITG